MRGILTARLHDWPGVGYCRIKPNCDTYSLTGVSFLEVLLSLEGGFQREGRASLEGIFSKTSEATNAVAWMCLGFESLLFLFIDSESSQSLSNLIRLNCRKLQTSGKSHRGLQLPIISLA